MKLEVHSGWCIFAHTDSKTWSLPTGLASIYVQRLNTLIKKMAYLMTFDARMRGEMARAEDSRWTQVC